MEATPKAPETSHDKPAPVTLVLKYGGATDPPLEIMVPPFWEIRTQAMGVKLVFGPDYCRWVRDGLVDVDRLVRCGSLDLAEELLGRMWDHYKDQERRAEEAGR